MQDSRHSSLPSIVIMLFLMRLGASQNVDEDIASETMPGLNDKEAGDFLKGLLQKPSSKGSPKYNMSSADELNGVVNARFRKEMVVLFSRLSETYQCKILSAIQKKTHCSVPSLIKLVFSLKEMKHLINVNVSCPVKGKMKLNECSSAHKTYVGNVFSHELLEFFASLPGAFKCHVINTIALAYNRQRRRHLALSFSVSQAQKALEEIFPSVIQQNTCMDTEMDLIIPSIPPINVTVNMAGVRRESWLKYLMQKGPDIYKAFLGYEWEMRGGRMLGSPSTAKYLADKKEEINSAQLSIVRKGGHDFAFSVLFLLKVKRKQSQRLREIRSTYKIVQALETKTEDELREIFNATIIGISLSGQKSNITKTPSKTNTWTLNQVSKAKHLFPDHLSGYYKELSKAARCFIVLYMSRQIKKSPQEAEMFYVSLRLISRKHTCYYTWRKGPTDDPIGIRPERFTARMTQAPVLNNTGIPTNSSVSTLSTNTVNDVSAAKVHTEDFSSLEIVLFALLGLFCFSVLAFTVNCVLLAFRANAKFQKNRATKTVLPTATSHKDGRGNGSSQISEKKECSCRPVAMETKTGHAKICNCVQCVSFSATQKVDERCKVTTYLFQSYPLAQNTSESQTNPRTHSENAYCVDYSPKSRTFNTLSAVEGDRIRKDSSSESERNSLKTDCLSSKRELDVLSKKDNDRILEWQGKAISYCSISDGSCRGQLPCVSQSGRLPSEQSHETVVVLLDYGGLKEVQV